MDLINLSNDHNERAFLSVVRIVTSYWADQHGLHSKKSLRYMKRLTSGEHLIQSDCANVGAEDCWRMIVNLDKCEDGLYQVTICNARRDYESGIIDDYDLQLVPWVKDSLQGEELQA